MLAAALISGLVAIAGRLWKANSWADAVALAIGYVGGHMVAVGWPAFPPGEATQWLPYFAILVMFVAVLDTLLRPAGSVRALIWFLLCAGILRLLLGSKFQYGWSPLEGSLWITCLSAGMLVLTAISRQGCPTGRIDFVSADPCDCRWRNGSRPHAIRQHASGATCVCLNRSVRDDCHRWLPAPKGGNRARHRSGCRGLTFRPLAEWLFLCGASRSERASACCFLHSRSDACVV